MRIWIITVLILIITGQGDLFDFFLNSENIMENEIYLYNSFHFHWCTYLLLWIKIHILIPSIFSGAMKCQRDSKNTTYINITVTNLKKYL